MHFSVGFAFDLRVGPTVATATVIALKVCNFHFEESRVEALQKIAVKVDPNSRFLGFFGKRSKRFGCYSACGRKETF